MYDTFSSISPSRCNTKIHIIIIYKVKACIDCSQDNTIQIV